MSARIISRANLRVHHVQINGATTIPARDISPRGAVTLSSALKKSDKVISTTVAMKNKIAAKNPPARVRRCGAEKWMQARQLALKKFTNAARIGFVSGKQKCFSTGEKCHLKSPGDFYCIIACIGFESLAQGERYFPEFTGITACPMNFVATKGMNVCRNIHALSAQETFFHWFDFLKSLSDSYQGTALCRLKMMSISKGG